MATVSVTDDNFDTEVLKSTKPIVVDFWAEWCGPCKQIGPTLEEISNEMKDQVTIAKHNIDNEPNTPTKYGVRGIPTMLLFKDGELKSSPARYKDPVIKIISFSSSTIDLIASSIELWYLISLKFLILFLSSFPLIALD